MPPDDSKPRPATDRFQERAAVWRDLYARPDVVGAVYRRRVELMLRFLQRAGAAKDASILDAGCGAGPVTSALVEAAYRVHGTDAVADMVHLARGSVPDGATFSVSDAAALPFADGSFDAAVAMGLLPWVPDPEAALRELARVVRHGGHLVLSADNRSRLTFVVDPWKHPALGSAKRRAKSVLRRVGLWRTPEEVPPRMDRPERFDAMVARAGLERIGGTTFGFGPFTAFGRPVLGSARGLQVDALLERRATAGARWLRRRGNQYLVLARKP